MLVFPVLRGSSSDLPSLDVSGLDDGEYANPNDGATFFSLVARENIYLQSAASDGEATLYYLDGSGPDIYFSRCDDRHVVGARQPVVTVGPRSSAAPDPRTRSG